MGDNVVREGRDSPVSFKPGAYNRAESIADLGISLERGPGKIIDDLIEMAELGKKAQEEKEEQVRELRREIRDLEDKWKL